MDYPLAPGSKYPHLIECCLKSYLYIKLLVDKVLKLKKYRIVLTGDSAGGNICFGVLNWLIMNHLPRPKGVLVCYPACNLNLEVFSTSYLHCLHDYLLTFGILNFFFRCYLDKDCDCEDDFMIR